MYSKSYSLWKKLIKAAVLSAVVVFLALLPPNMGNANELVCRVVTDEILEKEYMERFRFELRLLQSSESIEATFSNVNISVVVCDYLVIFELVPREGVFGISDAVVFSKHDFRLLGAAYINPQNFSR